MLNNIQKRFFSTKGLNHLTKFYKKVNVEPLEENPNHFKVLLDKKSLKTPDGYAYFVPNQSLAHVVAKEFELQQQYLRISTMPLFGITKAAVDVSKSTLLTENSIRRLLRFIKADTVSFREASGELSELQQKEYDPVIDTFFEKFGYQLKKGATFFESTLENEEESLAKFENYLRSLNPWQLVATEMMITSLKSVCLGLMVLDGELSAERGFRLSRIEEDFQIKWNGYVEGAHDIDEAELGMMIYASALLFDFSKEA